MLNDKDRFADSFVSASHKFREVFPDFDGPLEVDMCIDYVGQQFTQMTHDKRATPVQCHVINATDPQEVQRVFNVIKERLLRGHMEPEDNLEQMKLDQEAVQGQV